MTLTDTKARVGRGGGGRGAAHRDKAMGFDLVDPEALLQHRAGAVKQLLQLAQGERPHLSGTHTTYTHTPRTRSQNV